jgi:hypothetical protein
VPQNHFVCVLVSRWRKLATRDTILLRCWLIYLDAVDNAFTSVFVVLGQVSAIRTSFRLWSGYFGHQNVFFRFAGTKSGRATRTSRLETQCCLCVVRICLSRWCSVHDLCAFLWPSLSPDSSLCGQAISRKAQGYQRDNGDHGPSLSGSSRPSSFNVLSSFLHNGTTFGVPVLCWFHQSRSFHLTHVNANPRPNQYTHRKSS